MGAARGKDKSSKLKSKTERAISRKDLGQLAASRPGKQPVLSIFLTAFYGNEEEGRDGADTVYVVRARSPSRAGEVIKNIIIGKMLSLNGHVC